MKRVRSYEREPTPLHQGVDDPRMLLKRVDYLTDEKSRVLDVMKRVVIDYNKTFQKPQRVALRLHQTRTTFAALLWRKTYNGRQAFFKLFDEDDEQQRGARILAESSTNEQLVYVDYERQRLLLNTQATALHSEFKACRLALNDYWSLNDYLKRTRLYEHVTDASPR